MQLDHQASTLGCTLGDMGYTESKDTRYPKRAAPRVSGRLQSSAGKGLRGIQRSGRQSE